jgi:hypothetical protein
VTAGRRSSQSTLLVTEVMMGAGTLLMNTLVEIRMLVKKKYQTAPMLIGTVSIDGLQKILTNSLVLLRTDGVTAGRRSSQPTLLVTKVMMGAGTLLMNTLVEIRMLV